jgi:sarcosine oxidase subunit alpha
VRENLVSVEHVKRYTTAGMSVDQGKTGNLNALTFLAHLTNRPVCDVGTTTFRPPYMPVCMGTIAGQVSGASYAPTRRVPAHKWHELRGAVFEDYGDWSRPAWYRRGDEGPQASIMHEATVARRNGGIFDGSPLGKIEVRGPDAAEFLNRIYLNNMLALRMGCVRYGFMLDENGVIMDDGVCARFDDDRYLVSTTAANCTHVAAWLDEWHQCEWPELKLVIVPVTTQWAVVTVFGPNSRACLSDIDSSIDFSADAFPHMQLRTGTICGFDARIQRVSYTGELSYEISIPASHGEYLIERIAQSGIRYGMVLVGVEAILTLRIEKGYVHVGSDTDGTTNPIDVGFGGILDKKKTDFVGRRSLSRPNDVRADRRQLVGLEAADGKSDFAAGAHVVRREDGGLRSEGFVTSATESPHLHRTLGLGMVEGGHRRKGEVVTLFDNGKYIQARIVDPVFYDSKGTRLHG